MSEKVRFVVRKVGKHALLLLAKIFDVILCHYFFSRDDTILRDHCAFKKEACCADVVLTFLICSILYKVLLTENAVVILVP